MKHKYLYSVVDFVLNNSFSKNDDVIDIFNEWVNSTHNNGIDYDTALWLIEQIRLSINTSKDELKKAQEIDKKTLHS